MSYNRTIHIVSHTHWDREWYFSTSDSLVLMDQTFSDILEELNENKQANFCLDGQVSIVEEYIKLYPEKLVNIQQLVKEKRLFIGPWYTQTDTQLVSGQSIIENLYYGIYRSKQLVKDYMKVGYLPDTFGFCNQMPMIMNQFSIDNFVFWRGADFQKQNIAPYFKWIGQDQSEVTGIILHNGYGMAKGFNSESAFVEHKLNPLIKEYKTLTDSEHILIPVGNDQFNVIVDLDKKIKEVSDDLKISTYEEFAKVIKTQPLKPYQGEFREVKYSRIHKSCGAIRIDIKKSNYQAEQELIKITQPLQVMAKMEGMQMSDNLIAEAFKLLFEGQAHDGIVGCVSDSVASDILNRNKQAIEIAKSAQNYMKKHFAKRLNLKEDEIVIFNFEPKEFYGYKEVEIFSLDEYISIDGVEASTILETKKYFGYPHALVETPIENYYVKEDDYYLHKVLVKVKLPSFGYKVFKFHSIQEPKIQVPNQLSISNSIYKISFEDHHVSLTYEDETVKDFISLWDMGNDGDTYDFSPLENDYEVCVQMQEASVVIKDSIQIMNIDCTMKLPSNIEKRKENIYDSEMDCKIEIRLQEDELIKVKVVVDNTILSHRIRLAIRGFEHIKKALAATPFGTIQRNVLNDEIENWQDSYVEYPVDIETNSGFVTACQEGKQLVVLNKGVKEYQTIDDRIYMTLFSSCNELGKPDLLNRPGRASGDTTKKGHIRMFTPLAQVLGVHEFEFAIVFAENVDATLYNYLHTFEAPSVFYQNQSLNLFYERIDNKIQFTGKQEAILPLEKSYMQVDNNLLIYSIYSSLLDGSMQIRFLTFEDFDKQNIHASMEFEIGNLLEQGNEKKVKAYRLYTLRGKKHENK
ncbi:glycoside hydrolase family 38 N-terminal domain-containing protein [Amedibacillus sp. YH-ame10]